MALRRVSPYVTLGAHLAARWLTGATRATLTFAALEATILRRSLRPTARSPRNHRMWWLSTGEQSHAWDGWLSVGWGSKAIDLATETVTFARTGAGTGKDGA